MSGLVVNFLYYASLAFGVLALRALAHRPALQTYFWPAALVLSALIGAFALLVSEPDAWFEDFVTAYWEAGAAIWHGPAALQDILERGVVGFVNLPIIAYLLAPLGLLPATPAKIIYFGLGGLAILGAWFLTVRLFALDRLHSGLTLFAYAAFGPIVYSMREGNSSHFILVLLLAGLLFIRASRQWLGGALFGFAALIKPPLLILGVLYALRGHWRVVGGGLGVCVIAVLASLAVFGWDAHVRWYEATIAPYAGQPTAAFNAQSFASFAARVETGLPGLTNWDAHTLTGFGRLAVLLATLALLAVLVRACWGARPSAAQMELEAFLAIAFVCLASTLSWSHYFAWLLPPAIAVLAQPMDQRWRIAAIAAFILLTPPEFLSPEMKVNAYGPLTNLLTSHAMLGALILTACLVKLRYSAADKTSETIRAGA